MRQRGILRLSAGVSEAVWVLFRVLCEGVFSNISVLVAVLAFVRVLVVKGLM